MSTVIKIEEQSSKHKDASFSVDIIEYVTDLCSWYLYETNSQYFVLLAQKVDNFGFSGGFWV